ncbi:LOW QUALITY PROTEIN: B-cell receptor CD22-like [Triplophysa dalaica]|uniref:LOW QUALITY PROTEIN: B-cell receptor CD22-like n=1 Tax=Triplophysa dalaica TaxID=1582913 RepID=UPI0024DFC5DD|nr:LOW QUALITY PROTEIN: B-cell receptor CD22-like [Triplophysa dalaica]
MEFIVLLMTYSSSHICALKDSTVTINCSYKYSTGHKIKKVFWANKLVGTGIEPPDLFKDSKYSERIQYLGDKQHDCSVRLTDVRHTDSHEYYFRFITDKDKWIGKPGVTLDVTDLQVESKGERVNEGHSVTLTCKSRCSLTDTSTFIWFRNTQTLNDTNKKLILPSVRRENAGDYRCAVQGHKLTSPPRRLNVIYPPDKPVISISSSGVIVEGDSVNLTCSSESNPPVHIYSWFKEETSVGSGNIYIISNIRSDHSGQYKCKTENKLGQKNSTVTLNVLYPPRNVSASISSSGVIVEGDSVNLTCSSESNPPVHIYSWFKENQTSSVGSGQTFSISNFNSSLSGWFYCVAQNEVGSQRSDDVSLTVKGQASGMLTVVLFAVVTCGFAVCVFIVFMRRRRRDERVGLKQVPLRCSAETQHDEVQYASVTPRHHREDQTSPESSEPEEVQYATVHRHRNTDVRRSEETEIHYDNITNHQHDAAVRSAVEMMDDKSVIYSSVR